MHQLHIKLYIRNHGTLQIKFQQKKKVTTKSWNNEAKIICNIVICSIFHIKDICNT